MTLMGSGRLRRLEGGFGVQGEPVGSTVNSDPFDQRFVYYRIEQDEGVEKFPSMNRAQLIRSYIEELKMLTSKVASAGTVSKRCSSKNPLRSSNDVFRP